MKLRNRTLIRLVALLAAWLLRAWLSTVRVRYRLRGRVDPKEAAGEERFVYAFWHESLLIPAGHGTRGKLHVLISQHADGELIARICQHLGYRTVRGSSTRGGAAAVRELLRRARGSHLAVTPDGPRGPRRRVQPGLVYLASRTGLKIVPAGIGFASAWRARSWDRFAVPKPWSLATVVTGEPISIPPDLSGGQIEPYRLLVEEAMHAVTAEAEALAAGKPAAARRQSAA